MKKLIIYLYLTILSGTLIVCTLLLSHSPLTDDSRSNVEFAITAIALVVVISLIIVAPNPKASRKAIRVFGERLTVDTDGVIRDDNEHIVLTLKDTDLEGITDMKRLESELETVLWYDYQDNKG